MLFKIHNLNNLLGQLPFWLTLVQMMNEISEWILMVFGIFGSAQWVITSWLVVNSHVLWLKCFNMSDYSSGIAACPSLFSCSQGYGTPMVWVLTDDLGFQRTFFFFGTMNSVEIWSKLGTLLSGEYSYTYVPNFFLHIFSGNHGLLI